MTAPLTTDPPDPPTTTIADLVRAVDAVTGGRLLPSVHDRNAWSISKSSGIPGKDVLELPGLLVGDPASPARKVAIAMTLTEHDIELAGALGVDVVVAHHTIADAASSGGVPLATYLGLYGLAVIECHEALHGLHPGIAYLHGHTPHTIVEAFAGNPGMVVMIGRPVEGVTTLGDVLVRLERLMEHADEHALNATERTIRGLDELADSITAPSPRILNGTVDSPLGDAVLHAFPHTGFRPRHLEQAVEEHPDIGTLIVSISRVLPDDDLVATATDLGLNVLVGNAHPDEILENGLPLAHALAELLPDVEFVIFRERVVALPVAAAGRGALAEYGRTIARDHLLPRAHAHLASTDGDAPPPADLAVPTGPTP